MAIVVSSGQQLRVNRDKQALIQDQGACTFVALNMMCSQRLSEA